MGWWPDVPLDGPPSRHSRALPAEFVFPSGRAAIAQSLEAIDLPPNAAIALQRHSSECLTRVVRRFGAPLDLCELEASVRAAVVHEQWGWPLTLDAWTELNTRFKGRLLLVDRVDSADFFSRQHMLPPGSVEVVSLSKLLGIGGGGLARANGSLIAFAPQPESDVTRAVRSRPVATLAREGYREFFKESRQAVHPAALAWLGRNCLETAAERELLARECHLRSLLDSSLAEGWPTWMGDVVARGAGPVWAPVLRGQDSTRRWTTMAMLDQRYGLVSASRLFNWSGDPLRPKYEMCLALPVHSGVADFAELVAALVR